MHPLVRKELREHRGVLVAMWVVCALGLLALLLMARRQGSPVVAWWNYVRVFGTLVSLALASRFVVREYGGRTQLFLETLPVSRAQVIAVKWLTSAACLLVTMALGFGVVLLVARHKVDLTPRFVLLLALRGVVFLVFVHTLTFLVGLTGRYRFVLWLVLAMLVFLADALWQLPAQQWPPLLLMSQAMPFEREVVPVQALWLTATMSAGLLAMAFTLALGFQGSWVVALSRRMSLNEKIVVTAAFVSIAYLMVMVQDRKPKPPFNVQDGTFSRPSLPRVMVAGAEGLGAESAANLANGIATDLQQLRDYLGIQMLPVVAVLPDASIDGGLFLAAELPDSDGVVVRGAAGSARFDEAGFRAFTLGRVLHWHSRGRASREPRRWLLDGFARWQVARNDPAQRNLLQRRAVAALQLLEAGAEDTAGTLGHWLTTREQLGDCLGEALAWRATELLSASLGDARFQALARGAFGNRSAGGIGALVGGETVDTLLQDAGAPATAALAEQLRRAIHAEGESGVPAMRQWSVQVEAVPMRGSTYELRHSATLDGEVVPSYAVRYMRLGPWAGELSRATLERVDAIAPGVLPASFPRGERLFTAVEVYSPQLQCTLRLGARRWQVQ